MRRLASAGVISRPERSDHLTLLTYLMAPLTSSSIFDDDNEARWEDMPVVREDTLSSGLDEEDQRKYHYVPKSFTKPSSSVNAMGNVIQTLLMSMSWVTNGSLNLRIRMRKNTQDYEELKRTIPTMCIYRTHQVPF